MEKKNDTVSGRNFIKGKFLKEYKVGERVGNWGNPC